MKLQIIFILNVYWMEIEWNKELKRKSCLNEIMLRNAKKGIKIKQHELSQVVPKLSKS